VIVENKPGGGAIVATDYVAKAAPDGYTLLVGASGMAINQSLYAKLPYDSVRDFVAISEIASFPLIMIVNASSPVKSVADFVTYAKADADKMNYASSSASFQLVTELFKQKTGAPMQAIPYKSANESVLAVVSGQVTTTIADAGPVSPQVKAGTVRALAIAAPKRMEEFPDVPTMKEAGADIDGTLWTGVFAPKATPPEIVRKLEAEFMKIAKQPDVAARLKQIGIEAVGNSTDAFTKILAADIVRWGEVAKSANIKIEQ
jgi:tripartite-type tricarboxylate transporter receptor subunit TctC